MHLVQAYLDELGIMDPTEVQAAAIPRVLQGGNVAIQCYTGSGKVCHATSRPIFCKASANESVTLERACSGAMHACLHIPYQPLHGTTRM